jgi:putative membrane protein insertion efficiency factor
MTGASADLSDATRRARATLTARVCVGAIRAYQLARSGRVSPCRFTPTCSEYAAQAFARHGTRRGLTLTIRRLGRCRPGGPFGPDPVPE